MSLRLKVTVMDDGREVCDLKSQEGRELYRERIIAMWRRQNFRCRICLLPLPLSEAQFEHEDGRGMNGGHRDDRIEVDGKPVNGAVCWKCNSRKGSKRGYGYG